MMAGAIGTIATGDTPTLLASLREKLIHDWSVSRYCLGRSMLLASRCSLAVGGTTRAFRLLSRLFDSGIAPWSDPTVISRFAKGLGPKGWMRAVLNNFVNALPTDPQGRALASEPERLIGKRLKAVKSWRPNERGALVLDYNYTFPIFVRSFDLARVSERYQLYIEPSWSGLLNEEVLSLTLYPDKLLCAAFEPRDFQALKSIQSNLVPVKLGGNCFVDEKFFVPDARQKKIYDLIMVAAWGKYKRHAAFFECLARLRQRLPQLRVALIGYDADLTQEDVQKLAIRHSVNECIDYFERIPATEVRDLLRKSRINVLWSRREGTPRTPVEGLAVDVPLILREGFNYGHKYDYINQRTGRFANETNFAHVVEEMLQSYDQFAPRSWFLDNLAASVSTQKLEAEFREMAAGNGETFSEPVAVRLGNLDRQEYENPSDNERFAKDHEYLHSCLK